MSTTYGHYTRVASKSGTASPFALVRDLVFTARNKSASVLSRGSALTVGRRKGKNNGVTTAFGAGRSGKRRRWRAPGRINRASRITIYGY
jgi:hypothetical protein